MAALSTLLRPRLQVRAVDNLLTMWVTKLTSLERELFGLSMATVLFYTQHTRSAALNLSTSWDVLLPLRRDGRGCRADHVSQLFFSLWTDIVAASQPLSEAKRAEHRATRREQNIGQREQTTFPRTPARARCANLSYYRLHLLRLQSESKLRVYVISNYIYNLCLTFHTKSITYSTIGQFMSFNVFTMSV